MSTTGSNKDSKEGYLQGQETDNKYENLFPEHTQRRRQPKPTPRRQSSGGDQWSQVMDSKGPDWRR